MKILAIESSCDETSASVIEKDSNSLKILSLVTATSLSMHALTGGIIPENAARMQVKYIIPVIIEALLSSVALNEKKSSETTKLDPSSSTQDNIENWKNSRNIIQNDIDAIAVTHGPGLVGSLLVGVETAKTLSYVFDKPIIPVDHLLAHIYANFISKNADSNLLNSSELNANSFPFIGLIVSGGHTDLLYFKSHNNYIWLGGTRDDAAGEAFDKIGRLLGLSYPAGPEIERRAKLVDKTNIRFKSPIIGEGNFDFSFSGLKTEAQRFIQSQDNLSQQAIDEICYATQKAIFDVLVKKTLKATEKYNCKTILLGGGVSANQTLIEYFIQQTINHELQIAIFSPEKIYCTDNAAMIGAYALLNPKAKKWNQIHANPDLYFA